MSTEMTRDDVDLFARQLGDDRLDARAALADGRPDRIEPFLARSDGHLRAAAGLAGDRPDLDRPAVDLRDLELEQSLQESLMGAADEDLGSARGASNLEDVGLDVLADPVMLDGRLLRGLEDRLDVVADIEDDRPRLDPIDGAGDHLALATGEPVEDLVALDLADPLEDDLLGRLRTDPAEDVLVQLRNLDEIADLGVRLVAARLLEIEFDERILDLGDRDACSKHTDAARLGVDPDVDVLVTGDAAIG